MNHNVNPSIVQIDKEDLKQLVTEVKETLATNINLQSTPKNKKFAIVDMWNCQRNVRTAVSMRKH